MADQRQTGKLGFCGNRTYGEIGAEFHSLYDGLHPELTVWRVDEIHRRWRKLGKLTAAGRL